MKNMLFNVLGSEPRKNYFVKNYYKHKWKGNKSTVLNFKQKKFNPKKVFHDRMFGKSSEP